MDDFHIFDAFATKGLEYLIVIAFLVVLTFAWRYLNKPPRHDRG